MSVPESIRPTKRIGARVKRALSALMSAAVIFGTFSSFAVGVRADIAVSPGVAVRTTAGIAAFAKSHPSTMDEVISYSTPPSLKEPYSVGKLSAASTTAALNMLNLMR